MQEREHTDQPRPEITIHKSSSREGQIGWTVALIRREGESDDDYTQRVLAKHHELENELTMKVCCHSDDDHVFHNYEDCLEAVREGEDGAYLHDSLDDCEQAIKEGARA